MRAAPNLHRLPFDAAFRDSINKLTFRDILLSVESRGKVGLRRFLPITGIDRYETAKEIVRIFGANRNALLLPNNGNNNNNKNKQEEIFVTEADERQRQLNRNELILNSAAHSVFGRPHTPVSFMLDIDAKHQDENETKNSDLLEDRLLGFCLTALRPAFAKHNLIPNKVCILTAGDSEVKPYASLHVHIDFLGAAFSDAASLGNFMKSDLSFELEKLATIFSTAQSSASKQMVRRLQEAMDTTQFGLNGGSLRIYGSPKLNGTRPVRLFRPIVGGAVSTALMMLNPIHRGPTMEILDFFDSQNSNNTNTNNNNSAENKKDGLLLLPGEEEILNFYNDSGAMDNNKLYKNQVTKLELEALAMSLGTPDWKSNLQLPFRFISMESFLGISSSSSSASKSFSSSSEKTSTTTQQKSSSGSANLIPGLQVRIKYQDLPQDIMFQLRDTSERIPHPRRGSSARTFALVACKVAPAIPSQFAKPYRSWLSVCMALTDISTFYSSEYKKHHQQVASSSSSSTMQKTNKNKNDEEQSSSSRLFVESDKQMEEMLKQAFLSFSERASNYERDACSMLWDRMLYRKRRKARSAGAGSDSNNSGGGGGIGANEAYDAVLTMNGYFRKPC